MTSYLHGLANGLRKQQAQLPDDPLYMRGWDAGSLELNLEIEKHNELLRNIEARRSSTHSGRNNVTRVSATSY